MTDRPSIVEFVTDPQLLGLTLSPAQEVLLRALYGLPLEGADHLDLFRLCTGRERYPERPFGEATVIAGARSGKDSRIAAPVSLYEGIYGAHEAHLARGEQAVIPLVAQDQRGTRVAFGYVRDYIESSPLLRHMLDGEPMAQEIRLTNRVSVVCFACTMRGPRGFSIPAGVMDELGFYRLEGAADSDVEIQAAIRRGMLSFPAPRLLKISTPYMRSGVLYDDFKAAWGQEDLDRLVWRAPTALMNPSVTGERLDRERRLDPVRFAREYEAEFSEDLEAFLPTAWVDAAVVAGRHELPPLEGVRYVAGIDSSGGGPAAFTLSIVHLEGVEDQVRVVHDLQRGWTRHRTRLLDLEAVVTDCAALVKAYGCTAITGDRYGAGWVRQAFERHGLDYLEAPDKARAYLELEPVLAQGRLELLDHPMCCRELRLLERHAVPGGRTRVDHPRGSHDDHANALALAVTAALAAAVTARVDTTMSAEEYRQIRNALPGLELPPWGAREEDEAGNVAGGGEGEWYRSEHGGWIRW